MKNATSPVRLLSPEDERYLFTNEPDSIPKGLMEWVAGTELLNRREHGLAMTDIACVRAFWSCVRAGFSSSGFVVETAQGHRFYLRCAVDDDKQPDLVAITTEKLPAGDAMPECGKDIERFGGWSDEVGIFNIDLIRIKAGNAA